MGFLPSLMRPWPGTKWVLDGRQLLVAALRSDGIETTVLATDCHGDVLHWPEKTFVAAATQVDVEFVRGDGKMGMANHLAKGYRIARDVLVQKITAEGLAAIEAAIDARGTFVYPTPAHADFAPRRQLLGMSIEQVAAAANCTLRQVQWAEEGRGKIKIKVLVQLCGVLSLDLDVVGLPPAWLVGRPTA